MVLYRVDKNNEVYKVIEKEVISDEATVGITILKWEEIS